MVEDWINSSTGLPRDGDQIEFAIVDRTVALDGIYSHQAFHSRWAGYGIDRVCSWRKLTKECVLATPARHQALRVVPAASLHAQPTFLACGIAHAP